jgi:hypothetical protein
MAKIITLFFLLTLSGCSIFCPTKEPEPIINTVEVSVPVYQCPKKLQNLEKPQKPMLMIHTITDADSDGEVAKKYEATVKQLLHYTGQLTDQNNLRLEACKLPELK